MSGVVKHVASPVVSGFAVAAIAGLGYPAVALAGGLVVLALIAICWVVGSRDRTDRVTRIILGIRGDARSLYPPADPPALTAPGPQAGLGGAP